MRIPKPNLTHSGVHALICDLKQLIEQPTAMQSPPCPNCKDVANVVSIKGKCSSGCEHAPLALSEDPERYPIEDNVVPLVFELTSMRLVQTCWSCEGHLDINNEIWKLPQVSFYSIKPIYSQLLCNYLARLFWRKRLNYPWEVVLTNFGQTWDVTYTIKCDLSRVKKPDISLMQDDLVEMAEGLSEAIKEDAKALIQDIESKIKLLKVD